MLEFVITALPWIGLGVCIAIIIAKYSKKRKLKKENDVKLSNTTEEGQKEEKTDYMTMGMSIGMCLGLLFSTTGLISLAYGISFGMLIGMSIGMLIYE